MKTNKLLLASLAIAATAFSAQPLIASAMPNATVDGACEGKIDHRHGAHGHHMKSGHPDFMPPFVRHLNLSEAQKDQVFELMHSKAPTFRELGKKSKSIHDEMREFALSDTFDAAKAQSLADKAAKNHSEMLTMRAVVDQQIYALLNAEQRSKLAAEIAAPKHRPRK